MIADASVPTPVTAPVRDKNRLSHVIASALIAALATAAFGIIAVFVSHLSLSEVTDENIRRSFLNGSVQSEDWPSLDWRTGYNQYDDCLLIIMALLRSTSWADTIAPTVIFNDWPRHIVDPSGRRLQQCEVARILAFSKSPWLEFNSDSYFRYGRYVHAYRAPMQLFLHPFSVHGIRILYATLTWIILAAMIIFNVLNSLRSRRALDEDSYRYHLSFVWISLSLSLFYGVQYYSVSLAHGPADILLFLVLAICSLKKGAQLNLGVMCAIVGALAYSFDFFFGTIPLAFAVILSCAALRVPAGTTLKIGSVQVLIPCLTYILGVSVAVGLKLGLLWLTFGGDLIANYWSQLKHRVDVGGTIGMVDVMAKLISHLWQIAWGSKELGYAIMFAALLIIIFSLVWVLIWGINKDDRIKIIGLLGSVFVIAAWFTLFRNHTYVHAGAFMTRLLAWPIAVAGAMLIWILRSSLRDRASPRKP